MPRVVPSQVVKAIDQLIPAEQFNRTLGNAFSAKLRGILALAEQLPTELLVLAADEYSLFVVATESIQQQLTRWQTGLETALDCLQ